MATETRHRPNHPQVGQPTFVPYYRRFNLERYTLRGMLFFVCAGSAIVSIQHHPTVTENIGWGLEGAIRAASAAVVFAVSLAGLAITARRD